ncbi:Uncharacterised protein [Enterobacter hormaechei]|nr:Uncharacterised protein [Enterobacter hormaechei]CZW50513.1 Uncharacterised protein [Enterobacter hormaechei]CZY55155.1 Uncharacterised protein [Enterobacter hormaechei]CZY73440.1 Uncharacterised protein [Enterobacter hormaechei]CZZ78415.1 Uncharacterised protein [Enterobacter hormaechei]
MVASVKIPSAPRQVRPCGVRPRPSGSNGRTKFGNREITVLSVPAGCQPDTCCIAVWRDNHAVQTEVTMLPVRIGPNPHRTATGSITGISGFSSIRTAWTCCWNQLIRLFISTCCCIAGVPPELTHSATEPGAEVPLQTFTPSPRIAVCQSMSFIIALPTCPFRTSGTEWPVALRNRLICQRRASKRLVRRSLSGCCCGQTLIITDS